MKDQNGRNQRKHPSTEIQTVSEEPTQLEKKKRKLTPTQLATLAEGRKKRWEKKPLKIEISEKEVQIKEEKIEERPEEIKEEYVSSTSSDTQPTSSSDENDDIIIGGNSLPCSYSSATESAAVNSDSSGSQDSDSSSDQSENQQKNSRSIRKMKNYILKRTQPYIPPTMRLFL